MERFATSTTLANPTPAKSRHTLQIRRPPGSRVSVSAFAKAPANADLLSAACAEPALCERDRPRRRCSENVLAQP
jgi:hypothetical protein